MDVDGILSPGRHADFAADVGHERLLGNWADKDLSLGTWWRLLSFGDRHDPHGLSFRTRNDSSRADGLDRLLRNGTWRSGRRNKGGQRRHVDLRSVGCKELAVGGAGSADGLERFGGLDLGPVNVVLSVDENRRRWAKVGRGADLGGRDRGACLRLVGHSGESGLERREADADGLSGRLARNHLKVGELRLRRLSARTEERRAGHAGLERNSRLRTADDGGRSLLAGRLLG